MFRTAVLGIFTALGLAGLAPQAQAFAPAPLTVVSVPVTTIGYGCPPRYLPNMWGKCVPAFLEYHNYVDHGWMQPRHYGYGGDGAYGGYGGYYGRRW